MTTKIKISGFVKFLAQQVEEKAGYIMASYGQNPRTGYLDLTVKTCKSAWEPNGWYYAQYTSHKQHDKALYWRKTCKRVFDCQGLSEGYYEIMTGNCVNTQARYNYANWCSPKGAGMIPVKYRVPGAAIFWGDTASAIHHVAYLEKPVVAGKPDGDWYIIEARGVMYGVVRTRLYERKPNYWGMMTKYYEYDTTSSSNSAGTITETIRTTLKNGSKGGTVKELQTKLIELNYDLGRWGADGDFGDATEIAVKEFQKDNGLTVDGIVGPKTWAALDKKIEAEAKPSQGAKHVEIVGGNCNVRTAPNTKGKIIGVALRGTKLEYLGETDENTGWYAVKYKDDEGWVSCKYGRLVE